MSYREDLADKIIKYGKLCGDKNYTPGYSGNISARYNDGMLITTSGSSNGYLTLDDIVYTDFDVNLWRKEKNLQAKSFYTLNCIRNVKNLII